MAQIKPFRGILYNRKRIDVPRAVAPPYDVISSDMQRRFYEKSKHNIVRIILGKGKPGDTPKNNKYTRAGRLLKEWLGKEILKKTRKPSIYIYTQTYLRKNKKRTRIGFIALMKIEDPKKSGILPHEYTLEKPKKDRMNLITKTKANLSPIFSLFRDKENKVNRILKHFISSRAPLFTVDAEGVTHKLWEMAEKKGIDRIIRSMREKKIFIADGHHRYEVALAYRDMTRKDKGFLKAADYVMMYFSNLSERGNLTILSTHRVVNNIERFNARNIRQRLKKYFYIKDIPCIESAMESLERSPRKKHVLGMYTGKGKFLLLTLKGMPKRASALERLDVTVLHDIIINKILCVKNPESSIKYVRNERDGAALVDKGDYQAAFFLRPTAVTQMRTVAERGEMMPQKSTYFYPKLLTGLVINKF